MCYFESGGHTTNEYPTIPTIKGIFSGQGNAIGMVAGMNGSMFKWKQNCYFQTPTILIRETTPTYLGVILIIFKEALKTKVSIKESKSEFSAFTVPKSKSINFKMFSHLNHLHHLFASLWCKNLLRSNEDAMRRTENQQLNRTSGMMSKEFNYQTLQQSLTFLPP